MTVSPHRPTPLQTATTTPHSTPNANFNLNSNNHSSSNTNTSNETPINVALFTPRQSSHEIYGFVVYLGSFVLCTLWLFWAYFPIKRPQDYLHYAKWKEMLIYTSDLRAEGYETWQSYLNDFYATTSPSSPNDAMNLLVELFLHWTRPIFDVLPDRYWAVAIPAFVLVAMLYAIIMTVAVQLTMTQPLDSLYCITDEYCSVMQPSNDALSRSQSLEGLNQDHYAESSMPSLQDIPLNLVNACLYDQIALQDHAFSLSHESFLQETETGSLEQIVEYSELEHPLMMDSTDDTEGDKLIEKDQDLSAKRQANVTRRLSRHWRHALGQTPRPKVSMTFM